MNYSKITQTMIRGLDFYLLAGGYLIFRICLPFDVYPCNRLFLSVLIDGNSGVVPVKVHLKVMR